MRSTTYSAVERGVASTAGINPTNILAHERAMIAEYINDATRYCWDYYPWAEFTITEKRFYRPKYDPLKTDYVNGDEVYHQGKYWRLYDATRNSSEIVTLTGVSSIEYNIDGTSNDVTSIVVNINGVSERYSVVPSDYQSTNFGNIAGEYENSSMQSISFNISSGKITGGQMIDYNNGNTSNHFQYTYTQASSPSQILQAWHEVGDVFADTEWSESSLYKIGARVSYNDKSYICKNELNGSTASGIQAVNFEFDGITPEDSNYFLEVDTTFERYIPYEDEGYETIGTIISVHTDDPRYNDSPPINWREGREGVYVEKLNHDQPHVWVKYRKESPVYSTDAPDEKVPNFLVPAIKAYAYKSWLIGNGQHEKAMLQDIAGLDLLVREVDKLNSQQDRGLPYTIPSEPYRRLNARGSLITEETKAQIGGIKESLGELTFKLSGDTTGRNAVKSSSTEIDTEIAPEVSGRQIVKSSEVIPFTPSVWTIVIGQGNVSKKGSADIKFTITTGKSHRKIPVGYINGYKYAFCLATIDLDTHNLNGYNAVVYQGGEADASVLASEISGYNAVKYRDNNEIDFTILSSDLSGRQVKRESSPEINFALESDQSFTRIRGRVVNPSPDLVVSVDNLSGEQIVRFGTLDANISLNLDIVVASWASSASFDDLNISWEKGT